MPWHHLIWTDLAREKIAAHDVTESEVEQAVFGSVDCEASRTTRLPLYRGYTDAGRMLIVVFRHLDDQDVAIEIITAYEPE